MPDDQRAPKQRSTALRVAALVAESGGAVRTAASLTAPSESAAVELHAGPLTVTDSHSATPDTALRLRRAMQASRGRSTTNGSRRALDDESVATLLGGSVHDHGVVVVDRVVPRAVFRDEPCNLGALARRGAAIDDAAREGLVYLDTETTGLAGGTGTVVFILGLARAVGPTVEVRQFVLTRFAGEARLLAGASDWLESASGIVTYNGLSFDVPLLLTRLRLAELPALHRDHLSRLPHLDLLHPVRAAFAKQWPNCTLQMAERQLLNQTRVDDLPGSMVPAVFTDLVRYGRTTRLRPAVDHNSDDLVSLVSLVDVLGAIYSGDGNGDAGGVARRLVRQGTPDLALTILRARNTELTERDQLLLATLERRAARLARQAERATATLTPGTTNRRRQPSAKARIDSRRVRVGV